MPSLFAQGDFGQGTSLYSGSAANPVAWNGSNALTEGIWNSAFLQSGQTVAGATTGGLSAFSAMPSYQSSAAASLGLINGFTAGGRCGAAACREVPDGSADGDPSTGTVIDANTNPDGGGSSAWMTYGGTSAAAPLWAAFTALANALPSCRGLAVGDVNPSLYALAGANYAGYFRDVTAPSAFTAATSNDTTGAHPGVYPVGPGYDLATGLGTPLVQNLAPALCSLRAPVYTVTVANPGTVRLPTQVEASIQVHATDSGGAPLAYAASGLPAGLAISPTTGRITGTASKTGRSTVTVAAENFATNAGSTQFTLVVIPPAARFSRVALTGIPVRRARLKFTVTRPQGRRLRSVTVRFSRRSGLSFGRLRRVVFVTTATGRRHRRIAFRVKERRGPVTIEFRRAQKKVSVEFGRGAIRVSGRLARRARRHRSSETVRIRVAATVRRHRRSHHRRHHHERRRRR
ncbi:MAG TPA: putative Ig domain-containing protein [Solirubrobacteraceae bacterium]|nr:putative Ig domain-containing protein [Solirubrobacteraceae bacterium]